MIAIMGASGSGKSTLMNILGCLDRPTSGHYYLDGQDVSQLPDDELSEFRGRRLGFIFQNFNLIQQLTVLENLEVPQFYLKIPPHVRHQRALEMANRVGLGERLAHRPGELSGGEQQRVLLARALCQSTPILLLDEPTAHLDLQYQVSLLELVNELAHKDKLAVLVALHDLNLAAHYGDRIALMVAGNIKAMGKPKDVLQVGLIQEAYCLPVQVVKHPFLDVPLVLPSSK
jgi:putative ABC transport system ATP-binding protein